MSSSSSKLEQGLKGGAPLYPQLTAGGNIQDNTQPAFPVYHRKLANPGPLGLCGFALTTFLLSVINAQIDGIKVNTIVVAPALVYGGLIQIIAGIFEFFTGNTFGCLVFSSYGAFWISLSLIFSTWSGITTAYTDKLEFEHAFGMYLAGWGIFTFIVFIAALRSSITLLFTVFVTGLALWLLAAAAFVADQPVVSLGLQRAGGYLGILAAFGAWYTAAAGVITAESSGFILPVGDLSRKQRMH